MSPTVRRIHHPPAPLSIFEYTRAEPKPTRTMAAPALRWVSNASRPVLLRYEGDNRSMGVTAIGSSERYRIASGTGHG